MRGIGGLNCIEAKWSFLYSNKPQLRRLEKQLESISVRSIKAFLSRMKFQRLDTTWNMTDISCKIRHWFESKLLDTMLFSYVNNSTITRHNLDAVSKRYLNINPTSYEDVAGKGLSKYFSEVSIEVASEYASEDADISKAYEHIEPLVQKETKLQTLFWLRPPYNTGRHWEKRRFNWFREIEPTKQRAWGQDFELERKFKKCREILIWAHQNNCKKSFTKTRSASN